MNFKATIALALTVLVVVVFAVIYFSNKKTSLNNILNSVSSRVPKAGNKKEIIIKMTDNMSDLPISVPDSNLPQTPENSGCTGKNTNKQWVLGQHFNDYSVCRSDAYEVCKGATWAKQSQTARLCYWAKEKRSELAINTDAMMYHGCYIARTDFRKQFKGGYSMYHTWDASQSKYVNTPYMKLSQLEKIIISTKYSTDYYENKGQCTAADYAGVDPKDIPTSNPDAAFSYISFAVSSPDKTTQVFYQASLYDNREFMRKPDNNFISCDFAPNTAVKNFIVVTEPITIFGQQFAMPGAGIQSYSIDVLPKIKEWINYCKKNDVIDINTLEVKSLNIGNEASGKHIMTNTVIDPQIKLVLK